MKISGRRIEGFLDNPTDGVAAVLVYGPDQGLVRERSEKLVKTIKEHFE